jgi:predicted O-methyltransferase YrrM
MRGGPLANTARNALRPGYAGVIGRKAVGRFRRRERTSAEALAWARSVQASGGGVCKALDETLWHEALRFRAEVQRRVDELSRQLDTTVGYGVRADLLYFMVRWLRPTVVVETGVAYGYSSFTILSALAQNGHGRLWSSDFPFFRDRDPERIIGALVPAELRTNWTLHTRGDARNLPAILREVDTIDLLHYDSDKSYAGRRRAFDTLLPRLAPGGVVLMDDIEDNTFFRDHVTMRAPTTDCEVMGDGKHFVGAIGLAAAASARAAARGEMTGDT